MARGYVALITKNDGDPTSMYPRSPPTLPKDISDADRWRNYANRNPAKVSESKGCRRPEVARFAWCRVYGTFDTMQVEAPRLS
jgi:hypothetical protein